MSKNSNQIMTQKFTYAYVGSDFEMALTLNRGTKWSIQKVQVYGASIAAGGYFQLFRKDSTSATNERDVTHADSHNVLMGESYYDVTDECYVYEVLDNTSDMGPLGLRIRGVSLGATSHNIYINVTYVYTTA